MSHPIKFAKVGVSGARDAKNFPVMRNILDLYHKRHGIGFVVTGDAGGADAFAVHWAKQNEVSRTIFAARWSQFDKEAGPLRNQLIAEEADLLIAFPGPDSTGTWDTIDRFEKMGKPVYAFETDGRTIKL